MKTKPTVSKMLTGIEKAGKLLLVSGTLITAKVQVGKCQTGMDYVVPGSGLGLDRLRVIGPNNSVLNSKGIGVYQANFPVASALEVNTDFTHFPASQTTPYQRGEVFRTNCPSTQNTFWRMFRGGVEMFHINNNTGSDDISLNVVQNGSMIFSTHNLPRMKIDSSGMISIENLRCKRCFVMTNEKGELLTMEAEEVFRQLEQQQAFLMEQQKQIAFLQQEVEALKQKQEKLLCNKQ